MRVGPTTFSLVSRSSELQNRADARPEFSLPHETSSSSTTNDGTVGKGVYFSFHLYFGYINIPTSSGPDNRL